MDKQPTIAELRFAEQGISLYGIVMQMCPKNITVKLNTLPGIKDLIRSQQAVEMIVVASNTMYMAATQINSIKDETLQLSFTSPVRSMQRRKEKRMNSQLEVNFRSIQDNGVSGLWKQGVSRDVSSGGMCLVVPPSTCVSGKIELLFMLPDQTAEMQDPTTLCAEEGTESLRMNAENRLEMLRMRSRYGPLKAVARVANKRHQSDNHIALGLCFTQLAPADQIRLARFLNEPFMSGD